MSPLLRSRSLLVGLLLMTSLACGKKRQPSEEYTQAYLAFGRLIAAKMDQAYVDPEMTSIEEQLRRVPEQSLDAEAAAELLSRISQERQRVQREQQALRTKVAANLAAPLQLEGSEAAAKKGPREPPEFDGNIETVGVDSLPERTRAGNKATLVFIYASWCPACRQTFPTVNQLALNYQERGLEVVGLSIDEDPSDLVRYLKKSRPAFQALRAAPYPPGTLKRAVSDFGGTYPNAIPYLALLDGQGRLVAQSPGNLNRSALAAHIERTLRSQ
ncbi:TlpA family protein disulfide reductase [Archangium lansingense]|uniref:TlpA family protein disulfide reductase n=1 Tax=Archangium lansingense TaxID=2995310 RepID=UPI003B7912BE